MPANANMSSLALTPAYRHAQRVMAQWLDAAREADARRTRFAWRSAWAALDAVERNRMLRWLAWQCIAAASHGDRTLRLRLRQLDASWGSAITQAMHQLPIHERGEAPRRHALRLSA